VQVKKAVSQTVQGQTVAVLLSLATVACEAGPAIVGFLDRGTADIGSAMLVTVFLGYLSAAALFLLATLWAGHPIHSESLSEPVLQSGEQDVDMDMDSPSSDPMTVALSIQGLARSNSVMLSPRTATRAHYVKMARKSSPT